MGSVSLEGVHKVYPDGTHAVRGVDLDVQDGEFVVLVGPSGCGKTTALRMIAGLEQISEGTIRISSKVVNRLPPRDRDIAMVFQDYALYPHLTAEENIGFGLRLRRTPKHELVQIVRDAAAMLGVTAALSRRPAGLSGGQRQRVATGRAIVRSPEVFLMDEPLSNLDAKLRVQMRGELARLQHELRTTTIYVTHDQTEAMTMGDRVAVMHEGLVQQCAPPRELYERPANLFVAGFIGSPAMNLVFATLKVDDDDSVRISLGSQELPIGADVLEHHPALRTWSGREIVLGLRPEGMDDASIDSGHSGSPRLAATVDLVEWMGSDAFVHFTLDARPARTQEIRAIEIDMGLEPEEADGAVGAQFVARVHPNSTAREGTPIELMVDTARMHFFDPESGLAIVD